MNIAKHTFALAALALAAFAMPSCVVPEGGYAAGPGRTYSNYTVTYADGYAGRGYYYGPPNVRYYERQPGITYYRTRESVPSHYWSHSRYDRDDDRRDSYRRSSYSRYSHPTSTTTTTTTYTLRQGDGYAGRGYYYGPPDVRYYERAPGVEYYRSINEVPRQYRTQTTIGTGIGLGF